MASLTTSQAAATSARYLHFLDTAICWAGPPRGTGAAWQDYHGEARRLG
jgi:hypothetical protein